MAVIFDQIPAAYSPSDNPLLYVFHSAQYNQPNFSFIVEVVLNSVTIFQSKIFPENGAYAHYDASDIVKYSIPKPTLSTVLAQANGTMQDIKLTVTESYGTPPALQTPVSSTTTRTWKACLSEEDFLLKDFATDYQNSAFLTNAPLGEPIEIIRGQDVYLEKIMDVSGDLNIKFYDANDTLLETYIDTQNYPIWQLNLKDSYLDAVTAIDIADVSYFIVKIGTSLLSNKRYEFFDDYCNYPFVLTWMNEYGSFDHFVFKHNNEISANISSNSFRSQFGGWSSTTYVYSVINTGQIDYAKNIKEAGVLTTDYITEEFQNWLVELFKSPYYLLTDITGYVIAITVDTSSYKEEQARFEELLMIEVSYTKSSSNKSLTI